MSTPTTTKSSNLLQDEATVAWLATTGSQIFFMQLGFLAYEVGFVKPMWAPSIILKNIEDTFVGVLTFLCFSYTLSESPTSIGGIIAYPENPFLIGTSTSIHAQILTSAFFATTCDTIISGAVLERMKNKAYIVWCMLIILVNYSFVAHWAWHPHGWLSELGFVDGAGAVVVHTTGGVASAVAIYKLGPRKAALDDKGNLLPVEAAARPIINAIGTFILWYGWFAFNIASPIAYNKGIGDAIGTTALVTVISPICASCCSAILMGMGYVHLSYENLLACLLAGIVSITGTCHTCNVWEGAIIGFFAAPVYYGMSYVVRYKLKLDDPLQIIAIHLCCGAYSCLVEGIFANDVYGTPGLIYGGYEHFGVQVMGVVVTLIFQFILCLILWTIMDKILFRNGGMRVGLLDTYLGTKIFNVGNNYGYTLEEVLKVDNNPSRKMIWQFHQYIEDRFADEQLDFLIACNMFKKLLNKEINNNFTKIIESALHIISLYIDNTAERCVNIAGPERARIMKIKAQLIHSLQKINGFDQMDPDRKDYNKYEETGGEGGGDAKEDGDRNEPEPTYSTTSFVDLYIRNENIFNSAYEDVKKIVLPLFIQFLNGSFEEEQKSSKFRFSSVKIPFNLRENWLIRWDQDLQKGPQEATLSHALLDFDMDKIGGKYLEMDKFENKNHKNPLSGAAENTSNSSIKLKKRLSNKMDKDLQESLATSAEYGIVIRADDAAGGVSNNRGNDGQKDNKIAVIID